MCFLRNYLLILIISLFDSSVIVLAAGRVPFSPCPATFQYAQQFNGETYGKLTLPYDGISSTLKVGLNASMKGYYTDSKKVSIKIKLDTPGPDIIEQKTKNLRYSVFFPFQHSIPKITNIDLNGRSYCKGPPEELIAGEPGVTSLWSGHTYFFDIASRNNLKPAKPTHPFINIGQPIITTERIKPSTPSTYQYQECGTPKITIVPLILGGNEIADGTYPWLAAMFTTKGTGYDYRCTANLVSMKHVITAARCINYYKVQVVQPEEMLFVFGKSNLQHWATSGAVTRGAKKVQTHPDFAQDSGHADLSVVTLDRPLEYSNNISPICLWSGDTILNNIVNQIGTVAGWGADERAQETGRYSVPVAKSLDVPVVSQEQCLYSNLTYYSLTSDMTFCAGQRDGTGTCIGDSGSGFMLNKNGKYYLRGLVSLPLKDSNERCDLTYFMVFCDVAKFTDWIKDCMKP